MSQPFLYLKRVEVERLFNIASILNVVEEDYAALARGNVNLSTPRGFIVKPPKASLPYMLVKGSATRKVIGCRIIVYPPGNENEGTRFILISDGGTGNPVAMVNETPVFTLRVGAQVAVAARYLAVLPVRRLGIFGTGKIAEGVAKALSAAFALEKVYVTSRTEKSRSVFAEKLSKSLNVTFEPVAKASDCCREADVVVTATSANEPLIEMDDLRPGTVIFSIGGGQELAPDIVLKADKVLVDDWEYCRGMGDLGPLVAKGRFTYEDLYGHIGEVVAGFKPGRERANEQIVAIPQGLASSDVAVAAWLADQAREKGLGTRLTL